MTNPPAATPETELAAGELEPDPPSDLRERADAIRTANGYEGTLTAKMLLELEALLREPTPQRYVKHIPPTQGKPYHSTGVNSAQVPIDRMNDVLGAMHWRSLAHYAEGGTVCKIVVIVGNNLAAAKLDENGDLVCGEAEILIVREGWGGHSRGTQKGDVLKGAETNTLKRVLARVGPGSDVYRKDFDNDAHGDDPKYEPSSSSPAEAPVGARKASAAQQRLIRARAAGARLSDAQLCNVICRAAGSPLLTDSDAVDAMNGGLLERLPAGLVDSVLAGIAEGAPPPVAAPASPLVAPAMAPLPAAQSSDLPVPDLRVVPGGTAPGVPSPAQAAALVPAATLVPGGASQPAPTPGSPAPVAGQPTAPAATATPAGVGQPQPPAGASQPATPSATPSADGATAPAGETGPEDAGQLGRVDLQAAAQHLSFAQFGPGAAAPDAAPATEAADGTAAA